MKVQICKYFFFKILVYLQKTVFVNHIGQHLGAAIFILLYFGISQHCSIHRHGTDNSFNV